MPSNHQLPDAAEIWLSALRAAGRSAKTIETYGHAVHQLRVWRQSLGGDDDLCALSKLEARAFVSHLLDRYSPGGVRVRQQSLRALYGWIGQVSELQHCFGGRSHQRPLDPADEDLGPSQR
jgi:Phage integrase, N-terminal SAM-like domain